jgi:hypothetical protein
VRTEDVLGDVEQPDRPRCDRHTAGACRAPSPPRSCPGSARLWRRPVASRCALGAPLGAQLHVIVSARGRSSTA